MSSPLSDPLSRKPYNRSDFSLVDRLAQRTQLQDAIGATRPTTRSPDGEVSDIISDPSQSMDADPLRSPISPAPTIMARPPMDGYVRRSPADILASAKASVASNDPAAVKPFSFSHRPSVEGGFLRSGSNTSDAGAKSSSNSLATLQKRLYSNATDFTLPSSSSTHRELPQPHSMPTEVKPRSSSDAHLVNQHDGVYALGREGLPFFARCTPT